MEFLVQFTKIIPISLLCFQFLEKEMGESYTTLIGEMLFQIG